MDVQRHKNYVKICLNQSAFFFCVQTKTMSLLRECACNTLTLAREENWTLLEKPSRVLWHVSASHDHGNSMEK